MEEKGDCYSPTLIRGEESKQPHRYDMYVNATFFFCPSGDSFTRKALFDGLALNSIPVIFEDASLDVTYPQYFPGNPRDYSVLLNTTDDVMGQLRSIPKEEVRRMQSNIARIRESLSYSSRMDTRDATWVMMKEPEKYKQNGYRFDDPFANKTELKCIKERFVKSLGHKNKTCKMQGDFPAVITENATDTGTEVNAGVLQTKYRILCTSDARSLEAGSYQARCVMFKHWVDRCAPSVDLVLGEVSSRDSRVQYNATMFVKGMPPVSQPNLGMVVIDVVDRFELSEDTVPTQFGVIVQNTMHETKFPNHTTHVVEHFFGSYPLDMIVDEPEYIPPIRQSSTLKVGTVCSSCKAPKLGKATGINFTMIDENKEGHHISDWFLKFMSSPGWTADRMNATINNPMYGTGMLYFHIFREFDVLMVTPKNWYTKLHFGSIQRITSQMRSAVPVLVEVKGEAFKNFVDKFNYTCVYSANDAAYPTLSQAITLVKDASFRRDCQTQGLQIASNFSPSIIGKKLLLALGYRGDLVC
jgi:hypothetical protein